MFLEKGGQAAGTEAAIDAVTGKQVGGPLRIFFADGTKKTVQATPATSTQDLMEALKTVIIHRFGKTAKESDLALVDAQFRILSLHERLHEGDKTRDRLMKDTEKPWLLLQKPGQKSDLVVKPLRLPSGGSISMLDHFMGLLVKLAPGDSPFTAHDHLIEFENSVSDISDSVRSLLEPYLKSGQISHMKKNTGPPNKKLGVEWLAVNICLVSRITLTTFGIISQFCTCEEMVVNEKRVVIPWERKGAGLQEDMHLAPPMFAKALHDIFGQLVDTSLIPATKKVIKIKKFVADMGELATKIAAVLLHALIFHGEKLRKICVWDVPVFPLVAYVFYFFSDNGLLDKKSDVFTSFSQIDPSL